MWQTFCNWLLYKKMGWTATITEEHPDKYIICLAPHTSNWDFLIEWFFWPLGPIFRKLGGIPVWRSKKTSMTDNLAATARQEHTFHLCITPEGTRSLNPEWKKGFYYIAQKAELPILLYGVDYEKRHIQCTKTIIPNGDIDSQMREIKLYFKGFKGKHPENFTIGEI